VGLVWEGCFGQWGYLQDDEQDGYKSEHGRSLGADDECGLRQE